MQPSYSCLPDFHKTFHIESDASNTAVGSTHTQEHAYIHKPIAFLRKMLISFERNYNDHDHELLAIVTCCKAWGPHIDGQQTVVLIDHKPLIQLHT